MRKKILLATGLTIVSFSLFYTNVFTYISGADPGLTGAPGDGNCTNSGCHVGTPITNSSAISISMLDNGVATDKYAAGKTYTIKVELNDVDAKAAGFEATVKKGSTNIGTYSATASDVRLTTGNSNYVTHTNTNIHHTGYDMWQFNWTAPASDQGQLAIYAAANAANANIATTGDKIHLASKSITFDPGSSIEDKQLFSENLKTWPNPVRDYLTIEMVKHNGSQVSTELYTIDGKLLHAQQSKLTPGQQRQYLAMSTYANGIYILKVTSGENTATRRILKNSL